MVIYIIFIILGIITYLIFIFKRYNNHCESFATTSLSSQEPCSTNLTDLQYLEHMIPHHQVAVDMSKVLLKNTKNDFMIYLAYRIIQSQQEEIVLLNDLLRKGNIKINSNLII